MDQSFLTDVIEVKVDISLLTGQIGKTHTELRWNLRYGSVVGLSDGKFKRTVAYL